MPGGMNGVALANRANSNWLSGAQNWTKDVRNSRRNMGLAAVERLKELAQLRDQGILTEEEFAAQKAKVLAAS